MDENSTPVDLPVAEPSSVPPEEVAAPNILAEVAKKISESRNILIALSSNPSVDEMAAAIGLTLFLDRLDKRATAIYSGATPNALEFLKPEETFEPSTGSLQDFVIALNKEKADHIRYKLDGDYVKIYITPYKTRIDEKDLEFAYGDYNVDLVLALDVANGVDLDSALREHGRIMHDAAIINITTGNPGRFGEIEWSDKNASSISEMIARLLYSARSSKKIEKDDATAFLTGIVAATNRFSNNKTTPDTMQIASKLMESGANQQLISKNITPDVENELYTVSKSAGAAKVSTDPTKLQIEHSNEEKKEEKAEGGNVIPNEAQVGSSSKLDDVSVAGGSMVEAGPEAALLDDLKVAEANLAQAGSEAVPETVDQPVKIEGEIESASEVESELNTNPKVIDESVKRVVADTVPEASQPVANTVPGPVQGEYSEMMNGGAQIPNEPELPPVAMPDVEPGYSADVANDDMNTMGATEEVSGIMNGDMMASREAEKVIQPPVDNAAAASSENISEYGSEISQVDVNSAEAVVNAGGNPAAMVAPQVAGTPEVNGVPDMNYMPMPGQEILPPPPTPPIDMSMPTGANQSATAEVADTPAVGPEAAGAIFLTDSSADMSSMPEEPAAEPKPLGQQPAMQDQVYRPQAADPGAFKIPGM